MYKTLRNCENRLEFSRCIRHLETVRTDWSLQVYKTLRNCENRLEFSRCIRHLETVRTDWSLAGV